MDQHANCGRRNVRAESCRWISMLTVAPFYPKCAQTMQSQRSISNELQYEANQGLSQISKKISNDIHVIQMFFVTYE